VRLATQATSKMMAELLGFRGEAGYHFEVINGYVYNCLNTRATLQYGVGGILGTSKILRYGKARWGEVQAKSRAAADNWHQVNLASLPAAELLAGVRELFGTTADYFTVAQSGPIPLSTMSEALFSRFYNTLVKRKSNPATATFLLGLENLPLQAEKSLYDLAQWAAERGQADLADYLRQTPAQAVWAALKLYLAGQCRNPHTRLQAQAEQRRQAEQVITQRLDPLRRKWFRKLLRSAQDCAPGR
jgi:hypothetical protein